MAADRLSELPDDVLRRVLFFTPARDAAATSVLARRWRSLWRTSGAVNLDTRAYAAGGGGGGPNVVRLERRADDHMAHRRFLRDAQAALAAAHAAGPVTRLTVHEEAASLTRRRLLALLSGPAASRVEELHVAAARLGDDAGRHDRPSLVKLSFRVLPSEALRELHIANFTHLSPPPATTAAAAGAFPRLTSLRLQGCVVWLGRLQRILDACPRLATLDLQSSFFPGVDNVKQAKNPDWGGYFYQKPKDAAELCRRLVCSTVTTLVFADCNSRWPYLEGGLEIEAPRLQFFGFRGRLLVGDDLLLTLAGASSLVRADLDITVAEERQVMYGREEACRRPFWQFVSSFKAAKVLSLKLGCAVHRIAGHEVPAADDDPLLVVFHNLERLELEALHEPANKATAAAVATWLHCCPVVRDLRLKLSVLLLRRGVRRPQLPTVGEQAQLDFDRSLHRFRDRRRRRRMGFSSAGNDGGDNDSPSPLHEVSEGIIPGLSESSFSCLQHLRRVSLKLWMERPDCLGVKLARFFADNALVLEEMLIDDGNHKVREHVHCKVGRWCSPSSKRRNPLNVTSSEEPYRPRKRQKIQL